MGLFCFYVLSTTSGPGLFCIFIAPAIESTISPGALVPFFWRMVLETTFWALGILVANGVSLHLGPLS